MESCSQPAKLTKGQCHSSFSSGCDKNVLRKGHEWRKGFISDYSSRETLSSCLEQNHGRREVMVAGSGCWLSTLPAAFRKQNEQEVGAGHHTSRLTLQWSASSRQAPPDKGSTTFQNSITRWVQSVSHVGAMRVVSYQTRADSYDTFCYIMVDLTCFLRNNVLSIGTVLIADFCLPTESSTLNDNSQYGGSSSWND